MRKNPILILFFSLVFISNHGLAKTISISSGYAFRGLAKVIGYNGLQEKTLAEVQVNGQSTFTLELTDAYAGAARIQFKPGGSFFLILNDEDISVEIDNPREVNSMRYLQSTENQLLQQYVQQQTTREAKRSALVYLQSMYRADGSNDSLLQQISAELVALSRQEDLFLAALPESSYVAYYIPLRQYVEQLAAMFKENQVMPKDSDLGFYSVDLADDRFWHSGLVQPVFEGQVAVCASVERVQARDEALRKTVNHTMKALEKSPYKLLDVADFLLTTFETRGLSQTAEYLSLQLLKNTNTTVEGDLRKKMEQYRTLAIGAQAPDIAFTTAIHGKKQLYDLNTRKLLFFWKTGCAGCKEANPDLEAIYPALKEQNVEVIGISLDTDKTKFTRYAEAMTWPNLYFEKGWESQVVEDYFIYGTPMFYLLDEENRILQKPKSMAQLKRYLNLE